MGPSGVVYTDPEEFMMNLKSTLKTFAALAFALSPTIALAHPPNHAASAHMRPNLFHARAPQAHERTEAAHH